MAATATASALPTIVGDLGGLDRLAWVTSAFLLAQAAVTPIYVTATGGGPLLS
jgi:hypothetical protein